jgi:oxygen-independent coproporphyrinogen-3 oxidase
MPSASLWRAVLPEAWQTGGFGLYIHWPFCMAKCPYCDFNSHVASTIDQDQWKRAYLAEIARVSVETSGRVLSSVFFGGGTPSLMNPDLVADILTAVNDAWTPTNDFEVTLEANPTSVEAGRFAGYWQAGVNRVSMGIQALNDADLKALGRLHSVAEARAALDIARNTFQRVSFDLIYARQNQKLADWEAELRQALAMSVDHLSLYQLTIEGGTAFGDRFARGRLPGLPDEDLGADLYLRTQEICEDAGMPAYEVSNHAKPGLESRHNMIYWRGGDYIGIGPGAHGRLTLGGIRHATDTALSPAKWLESVEKSGSGEASRCPVSLQDQIGEYLMMGLRLSEGINVDRFNFLAQNVDFARKVESLANLGLVERTDNRLRVTATGRPVLNAILRELLPDPTL